jgi:hypothetical protein
MSFKRTAAAAGALCAAALTLAPLPAQAGVVVSASGPSAGSYPVGRKIGDSERIVLRAGDTLTVLDGNGTRILRGAGTHTLGQQGGASARGTFAVLTERRSAQRVRTGAVRGDEDGTPVHSPNLWYVDVAKSGTMCLADASRVRLWRASTEGDAGYRVSVDGGGIETVMFMDGDMLAPWNTGALPITAGRTYRIAQTDGTGEREIGFVVLESVAEEPEALADQLIANGCMAQLELLSTATMLAEG